MDCTSDCTVLAEWIVLTKWTALVEWIVQTEWTFLTEWTVLDMCKGTTGTLCNGKEIMDFLSKQTQ